MPKRHRPTKKEAKASFQLMKSLQNIGGLKDSDIARMANISYSTYLRWKDYPSYSQYLQAKTQKEYYDKMAAQKKATETLTLPKLEQVSEPTQQVQLLNGILDSLQKMEAIIERMEERMKGNIPVEPSNVPRRSIFSR